MGILEGFSDKLLSIKNSSQTPNAADADAIKKGDALIALEELQIDNFVDSNKNLSSSTIKNNYELDSDAYNIGKEIGAEINLNRPIQESTKNNSQSKKLQIGFGVN